MYVQETKNCSPLDKTWVIINRKKRQKKLFIGTQTPESSDSNCVCYAHKYKGKTLKCQQGIGSYVSSITELQNHQFEFTKWKKAKTNNLLDGLQTQATRKEKTNEFSDRSKETIHKENQRNNNKKVKS